MCGSFCTLEKGVAQLERLGERYEILPVFSENAYATDTRFGRARDWVARVEGLCGREAAHTIPQVEPWGPKRLVDALVICPCTGNTLSKLAWGITDTAVTMAAKSCLRARLPVVVCLATNDALGGSAQSLGRLLNTRGVFFVPLRQDDPPGEAHLLGGGFFPGGGDGGGGLGRVAAAAGVFAAFRPPGLRDRKGHARPAGCALFVWDVPTRPCGMPARRGSWGLWGRGWERSGCNLSGWSHRTPNAWQCRAFQRIPRRFTPHYTKLNHTEP